MENDIKDLQKRIIAFRDARDWAKFHQPKELAISLAIEAAELLEKFQWQKGGTKEYQDENREDIGDELADVFIYALNLAHQMGFDVKEIVEEKLKKSGLKYPVEKAKGTDKKYTEL
ncbi:MAG: nucleotide pyrophosphohydrolase [Patescibacteria group bacterium]|jgi:NTP pyrophosphatase (non-canonical NTP hydrolase)